MMRSIGAPLRWGFAALCIIAVVPATAVASSPVAVATAQYDPATDTFSSSVTLYIGPGDASIAWTLHGGQSHDPDGDPLTFRWDCENRLAIANSPTNQPSLMGNWPEGTTNCTLTVSDPSNHTSSDTASVRVRVDTTPPHVTPPEDIVVSATEDNGARAQASGALSGWLAGASAADDSTANPTALPSLIGDTPVAPATLFPTGVPTTVSFRFKDRFGNIGAATATVTVVDSQPNDIFVGSSHEIGFGETAGSIIRIRGGVPQTFCDSTPPTSFRRAPREVIVDSMGRVVFLAFMVTSANINFPHVALLRCDFRGDTPHLLAVYQGFGNWPGGSVHFPATHFGGVAGLHLAQTRSFVIHAQDSDAAAQLVTEDLYTFSAQPIRADDPFVLDGPWKSIRYRSIARTSEDGPQLNQSDMRGALPDMTNYKGDTYSVYPIAGVIRRQSDPLRIHAEGFGGVLDISLFGGIKEMGGGPSEGSFTDIARSFVVNDIRTPDVPSGNCPPSFDPDVSPLRPDGGALHRLTPKEVAVMNSGDDLGLTVTSDSLLPFPYLTKIDQRFIDDYPPLQPSNDSCCRFQWLEIGCLATRMIFFDSQSMFHSDPNTGIGNGADRIVAGPQGLLGARGTRVFLVPSGLSGHVNDIATVPTGVAGIGVFPPQNVSPSGAVITIQINSPVDVLLTDATGRRIGVDSAGQPVNDFPEFGLDTGAGTHPRFYVIKNPIPGPYQVRSVGTGAGPFAVHVYSMDQSRREGQHIVERGIASLHSAGKHDFTLAGDNTIAFTNDPPTADAGAERTVTADPSGNAVVTLDGSGSSDPDGDALTFVWGGPFGVAGGTNPSVALPVGAHVLTLTVDDGHGAAAEDTVIVNVNAGQAPSNRAPVANAGPDQTVAATSTAGAIVTLNGAGSSDPDGDALTFLWTGPFGNAIGQNPAVNLALGTHTISLIVNDGRGGSATDTVLIVVHDATAPVIRCGAADAAWHAADAVIACTAADEASGLVNPADASFNLTTDVPAGTETPSASTNSRTVCDASGNCATAGPVAGNKVDKKAPAITISAPAGTYLLHQDATASYSCTDDGSGVISCSGPVSNGSSLSTAAVGTSAFSVDSSDAVGNSVRRTVSYAVTFNRCLLYDPDKAKASGGVFPVKLQLCDAGGVSVSAPAIVVKATRLLRLADGAPIAIEDAGNASAGGNFRFDPELGETGGYIFNLSTKGFADGKYELFFKAFGDAVEHSVNFQVKK